jgi:hypothetical protein
MNRLSKSFFIFFVIILGVGIVAEIRAADDDADTTFVEVTGSTGNTLNATGNGNVVIGDNNSLAITCTTDPYGGVCSSGCTEVIAEITDAYGNVSTTSSCEPDTASPETGSGQGNVLLGLSNSSDADDYYSVVLGASNSVSGYRAVTLGSSNTISSGTYGAIALGYSNSVSSSYGGSMAFGFDNTVTSDRGSSAIGYLNSVTGTSYSNHAIGFGNSVTGGGYSHAIGRYVSNTTSKSLAIGFNSSLSTNTALMVKDSGTSTKVGVGTSSPNSMLEVKGTFQINSISTSAPSSSSCSTSTQGQIRLVSSGGAYSLYVCMGSAGWKSAVLN